MIMKKYIISEKYLRRLLECVGDAYYTMDDLQSDDQDWRYDKDREYSWAAEEKIDKLVDDWVIQEVTDA